MRTDFDSQRGKLFLIFFLSEMGHFFPKREGQPGSAQVSCVGGWGDWGSVGPSAAGRRGRPRVAVVATLGIQ